EDADAHFLTEGKAAAACPRAAPGTRVRRSPVQDVSAPGSLRTRATVVEPSGSSTSRAHGSPLHARVSATKVTASDQTFLCHVSVAKPPNNQSNQGWYLSCGAPYWALK